MEEVEFLNIDMDLESNYGLNLLVSEIEDKVIFTRNDVEDIVHHISCELAGDVGSPEYLLNNYLDILDSVSSEARKEFMNCSRIVFDIGYQGGHEPRQVRSTISPKLVQRLSKINAEIAITVYAIPE